MQISISNVIGSRSKSAPTLGEFISVWDTSLGDGNPSIQLPLIKTIGNYNFIVNWGDGNTDTITEGDQAERIHTYATGGTYTVTITGTIEGWQFNYGQDCEKLTSITNIGQLKLGNEGAYFAGCLNLTTIGGTFDLTGTTNFSSMFDGCSSLTSVNGIGSWDVSAVTDMNSMFTGATAFNQDISGWDVSSVTNMQSMFVSTAFNQSLNSWDVSSVTDMAYMFDGTSAFNQPLNSWNVSSVIYMNNMFANATAFNQDISGWDVSSVTSMSVMFYQATAFNQPLNSWDVSAVTAMNGMFAYATSFNQPLNSWNVSFVTDMYGMFESATAFNQDISGWDVSSVTDMGNMFSYATSFNQPLDLWNVSAVTTMSGMFDGAALFNQLLNSWDVSAVIYMNNMFAYATSFNKNISVWNISNVQYMEAFMEGKSTADYSHYDDLLNAWSLLTLQNGVNWDMGTIQYTSIGSAARASIISNYSWTIDDGGLLLDPNAQAFITAASITDPTQQSAINTLVVDLKGYNIWTKFKAIYPIVGGVASSHAVNLKTPGTFNLTFASGITHSANGMVGNGSSGYANTNFTPSLNGAILNSHHVSFYSRTNTNGVEVEFGSQSGGNVTLLEIRTSGTTYVAVNSLQTYTTFADSDSRGLYIANRTGVSSLNVWRNSTKAVTGTTASSSLPGAPYYLLAWNNNVPQYYSTKQCAFASIGDGLTDAEAANFYTAVQAYQTTLGRSIGTQTVSDADAQAFVNAANITDQVEANAVNNLVIGMKADGLWTKMKAIYPVVGSVASSHAVNLKTPGTYNLTFATGWTHSSTGMTPNGATYADTSLNINTVMSLNSMAFGVYSRTNTAGGNKGHGAETPYTEILERNASNIAYASINDNGFTGVTVASSDSRAFFQASRTASNALRIVRNTTHATSTAATNSKPNLNFYFGAVASPGTFLRPNDREIAFGYIADGFTQTECDNLYTAVQAFQTTLSRQV